MANLDLVTTDGARHDPMFRLGGRNVTMQVRSLRSFGQIAFQDGRLVKIEPNTHRPIVDAGGTIRAMRALLSDDALP